MKRILFLHIILLFAVFAWAQTPATAFPYECSFEESEDLSAWTLNNLTPSATDQWIYGTATHSAGKRSMYVSAYGNNPNYGGDPNVVVSYLTYKFPTAAERREYDISFDWKGIGDTATSKLYVIACPELAFLNTPTPNNYNDINKIVSLTDGRLSLNVMQRCVALSPSDSIYLCGSGNWQNAWFRMGVGSNNSQVPYVFAFIWVNANTQDSLGITSIAIDNFQINSAMVGKPRDVIVYPHCEDSTMLVTWKTGGIDGTDVNDQMYDIQYRKVGELEWVRGMSGIMAESDGYSQEGDAVEGYTHYYYMQGILEGSYDVRIRSKFYDDEEGEVRSGYVYTNNILVYCPDNHCVNYVNLYGPNVTCTYGYNPNAQSGSDPYQNTGVIDFGPDAVESRHTLHVDPTEYDPRTDSLLKTVPDGALASVRLGNWNWGGEAESITYDILVDSANQGILIVKYAIVFENPPGHDETGQPRFNLEVLDKNNQLIDQSCGHAEFTYESREGSGWHMTRDEGVAWKDWTTIGVNLMPYHGQPIKVRFTTMDCGWSGHYAYAYFVVDCVNAHIETENCGNEASVTCIAPEGFAYEWRNELGPVPEEKGGHSRELIVDASEHTYTCKVSFIEDPTCYFEISTISAPRFPIPDYTFERVYGECQSKLKFSNNSHVMIVVDTVEQHTTEKANDSKWLFRSLTTGRESEMASWSPTYVCRQEGDTIEVTMTAYIGADNNCDSTRIDTIIVPNIIPTPVEYSYITCPEAPYRFGDELLEHDTTIVRSFPNFAGCDSTVTLHLTVTEKPQDVYIHDSICSDQAVVINGVRYNQPLDNYMIPLKTAGGCDSVVYLTLTVNTRLDATILPPPYACADDGLFNISYDIRAGVYDSLQIRFNTPQLRDTTIYDPYVSSVAIPYPETILPGQYMASLYFYQFCCGVRKEERMIEVRYSNSIVEQKWNDVLTMLAPKYNGGYEFTAFQWFKDNMPLEGENNSYLYQPLDTESEYYVVATRKDGVSVATCPIQPVYREQQSEYPTIVKVGQRVQMYMAKPADIWYYTVSGQLYSTTSLMEGYGTLEVPAQPGVYILKSVNREGETKAQVMIVEQ